MTAIRSRRHSSLQCFYVCSVGAVNVLLDDHLTYEKIASPWKWS
jgi:hypothetical protein